MLCMNSFGTVVNRLHLVDKPYLLLPAFQKRSDESHSDINAAFGAHRSVSSQFGEHQLLSSLMEIKSDLSAEVRTLTTRMAHIDEQIGLIYNFLSPLSTSATSAILPTAISLLTRLPPPAQVSTPPSLLSPSTTTLEASSLHPEPQATMSLFDPNLPKASVDERENARRQSATSPAIPSAASETVDVETTAASVPPPPSVYNRSHSSSINSFGQSTSPRGSISNKIAPAPTASSPASPKMSLSASSQPISNTRYNPGRSPKLKSRSHHGRTSSKPQSSQSEQSTIIDLESPTEQSSSHRSTRFLSPPSKPTSMTKSSSSNVFRRFMAGTGSADRSTMSSSSTLLYPPTSDDERPISPVSSGNDDDDYRPLTSSSSRHHHHTPL